MTLSGDFDFIQAKTHGLRSRIYESSRLDDLCDLHTIPQLWRRLYPHEDAAGHIALQRRLLADHIHTLNIVREHLPEKLEPYFHWLLARNQVENLKVLLRAWKAKEPFERVRFFLAPLPHDFDLPATALLKAPSLADFLMMVPVPELRRAGERGAIRHAETGDTFFVELAFDAAWHEEALARQSRLPRAHRKATADLARHEAATYNLLTLFRVKLNYDVPYEQARGYFAAIAPHPFRMERLYDRPHFDDMVELIPRSLLPRDMDAPLRTIADLERALWQRLLVVANRQFYRSTQDCGGVQAFFVLKRVEFANLVRVIEGVRYGLGGESIRKGFTRVPQPAAR
ncbi:V-type ATPase subunit [bacterium]|nr:V-type ATPase subunit [bacterium]